MVNQSLHHFVELEELFRRVHDALHPSGYFLASDIIGRNGHMRWPEALAILTDLWNDLPEKYKYNHLLRRVELQYDNWDCSTEGFEGIRAQDILPLLLQRFHFEFSSDHGTEEFDARIFCPLAGWHGFLSATP